MDLKKLDMKKTVAALGARYCLGSIDKAFSVWNKTFCGQEILHHPVDISILVGLLDEEVTVFAMEWLSWNHYTTELEAIKTEFNKILKWCAFKDSDIDIKKVCVDIRPILQGAIQKLLTDGVGAEVPKWD